MIKSINPSNKNLTMCVFGVRRKRASIQSGGSRPNLIEDTIIPSYWDAPLTFPFDELSLTIPLTLQLLRLLPY